MATWASRLRLCAGLAGAAAALCCDAPARADDAFVLEVSGPETALVSQTLREELESSGAAPAGHLSVVRVDRLVTVTYVAADGRVIERTITVQPGARASAQEIALLAVSMMRDDGAPPPAEEPTPAPEPEATASAPTAPPEAAPEPARNANTEPSAPAVTDRSAASLRPEGRARGADDPCAHGSRSTSFSFDVVPYVGMSAVPDVRNATRAVALNLLGGLGSALRGFELSGLFNIETADACGVQLGGAVNVVRGSTRGLQLGGAVNVTDTLEGLGLAGVVNVGGEVSGVQLSGAVNVARADVAGAQLTGGVNVARDVAGIQLGTVNVARGRVRGVQLGLVNVAESSDLSLGLVNINTKGRTHIDVWSELEVGMLFSAVKHGGEHWHGFYGLGTRLTDPNLMAVFGVGGHLRFASWCYLDVDGLAYLAPSFYDGELSTVAQARATFGVNVIDELAFFAGPAFNTLIGPAQDNEWAPDFGYLRVPKSGAATLAMWPGATLGIQVLSE